MIPKSGSAGWRVRAVAVSTLALAIGAALAPTSLRAQSASPDNPAAASRLSLREALIRAVEADPSLPATRARTLVASAAVRQADVRPNPTLGLMVENLPTLGGGDILGRTETTLSYEQRLERVAHSRPLHLGVHDDLP